MMKFRSIIVLAICGAAVTAILAGGCDTGNGVAGGGDETSDFFVEYDAFRMKLEACAPGARLFDFAEGGNTLPLLDGLQAEMASHLSDLIEYANRALTCAEFFALLNQDQAPPSCETPGRTCDNAVINACIPSVDGNVLLKVDCAEMGLQCLDGECNLGLCTTDQCDSDAVVTCDDTGIRHEFRCGSLGLACGHGADSFQCIGTGLQCSTTTISPKCTGNVLTWCLGGKTATLDCAAITDARRECNQSWLDANADVSSLEIVTTWLHKVCGPRYSECADGVSMCGEDSMVSCRDGLFEEVYCPDYGFAGCADSGAGIEYPICTDFPAAVQ